MANKSAIVPVKHIESLILIIRGQRVMLDADLAELYGVETKALNRAVKRNLVRFPEDFVFQLTVEETEFLRRQIGTSRAGSAARPLIEGDKIRTCQTAKTLVS